MHKKRVSQDIPAIANPASSNSLSTGSDAGPSRYSCRPQADDLYVGHTAEVAAQLSELSGAFLVATAVSSLVMWLVVGSCTGLGLHRFLSKET